MAQKTQGEGKRYDVVQVRGAGRGQLSDLRLDDGHWTTVRGAEPGRLGRRPARRLRRPIAARSPMPGLAGGRLKT